MPAHFTQTTSGETINLTSSDPHSSVCVVSGNRLYASGYFVRRLTLHEVKELEKYLDEIEEYNKMECSTHFYFKMLREHLIDSSKPTTRWIIAGRIIFPFEQRTMPKRPKAPSFCTAPDTHVHQLDGCIVQNYKIYIGSSFVRELDETERLELDRYNMDIKDYQDRIIENMKQKLGTMVSGVWYPYERELYRVRTTPLDQLQKESENSHNTDVLTSKNEESTSSSKVIPLPPVPKPPKFCTQIF
uniref:Pepsin-I3 domain-containing protein n=1 Tax=Syphacia muris TaxID=451379 RepID=A0A0N5AKB3_9BILA